MRNEYYSILHNNPYIEMKLFVPMVKEVQRAGCPVTLTKPIPLRGIGYTIHLEAFMFIDNGGGYVLKLKWEDQGEEYTQHIPILKRDSNLVPGSHVYYFMYPYGYVCKKLFYISNEFRSRKTFWHIYRGQRYSRKQREEDCSNDPTRPYGKEYYKGKITPYGKRCLRYERKCERWLQGIFAFVGKHTK